MTDVRDLKLRRLDLTTLLVFERLMQLRKATAAAAALGLTPPAVSHALRRLRDIFGDELFFRRPHGLEPTPFAFTLAVRVQRAIEALREGITDPRDLDLSAVEATLRISGFDYELATLMPPLIKILSEQAPNVRTLSRALQRRDAMNSLARGDLDFAVGYFPASPEAVVMTKLYSESYAVVARKRRGRPEMTLKAFCEAQHILVSPGGDLSGIVDSSLAKIGRKRNVIAAVPQFFPALAIVRETGMLATIPRRLADRFAKPFGLDVFDVPVRVRSFDVTLAKRRRGPQTLLFSLVESELKKLSQAG